jgi:Icc protein
MNVLHVTDPHLYGRAAGQLRGVETDSSFRSVLETAFAHCDDYAALLVTGDLVQDEGAGYLRFRSILGNLRQPVLCIPGNHDIPELMHRELAGAPFQVCGTQGIGGWQFVMLDSCAPGHVGGRLAPSELARLDETLGRAPAHAMVCLHHHPIAMGSRWLDDIGLANADEFWRVIDRHSSVRAVVWGHVHQAHDGRRGDLRLIATPSTGAQFLPHSDGYAIDRRPPAFRHFRLHADGRIDTRLHWVDAAASHELASG